MSRLIGIWPPAPTRPGGQKLTSATAWTLLGLSFFLIVLLLLVPLLALLLRALPGWFTGMWQAETVTIALQLSLLTATVSAVVTVVFGTPVAYVLARYRFFGAAVLDVLIDLPMVLPPAVAGVALLMAFGRSGLIGRWLLPFGLSIPFTTAAVVMAQTFVAAPFFIKAAKAGFADVDPRLEQISATLGESSLATFFRITLPLARRALLGGVIMSWARALGEFGATILFAGNFAGRTQTMPLAIYTAMQTDVDVALVLASIMLVTTFALLLVLRLVAR